MRLSAERVVFASFLALGLVVFALGDPRPPLEAARPPLLMLTPLQLARLHADPRSDLLVLDLSSAGPLLLRRALRLPPGDPALPGKALAFAGQSPLARIVIVTDGGAPPEGLLRALRRGPRRVAALQGGAPAWQKELLSPTAPAGGDEAALREYQERLALSQALQGKGVTPAAPAPPSVVSAPKLPVPRQARAGGGGGC